MQNKFATILCLITVLVTGVTVFFYNQSIDFMTILHAAKVVIPAGAVAYFGGYFLDRILRSATSDSVVVNKTAQRKYVDDLLLTPEQVLTLSKLRSYPSSSSKNTNEDAN